MMDLSKEKLLEMYKKMLTIREFEQSLSEAVTGGTLPGFVHLGIGQEAIHVGLASALRATDWVSSTHRDHGMLIARGADIKRMRAEIFGKATGYCKGKGGSMHLAAFDKNAPGCNGILGPSQTINNGIALALKKTWGGRHCRGSFRRRRRAPGRVSRSAEPGCLLEAADVGDLCQQPICH